MCSLNSLFSFTRSGAKPLGRGSSRLSYSDAAHFNSGGFACFSAAEERLAEQSRYTHTFFLSFFFTAFLSRCVRTVWLVVQLSSDGHSSHRQLTAVTQRHVQHERACIVRGM